MASAAEGATNSGDAREKWDVVVVGAGTAGNYAAATIANAGYDVVILERKSATEAGHIACGDALKGATDFPEAIPRSYLEPAMTNTEVDHGRFEIPSHDTVLEIPVPGSSQSLIAGNTGSVLLRGQRMLVLPFVMIRLSRMSNKMTMERSPVLSLAEMGRQKRSKLP